jgi:hypothetical protein
VLVLLAITVIMLGTRVRLRLWMLPIALSGSFGAAWSVAERSWRSLGPPFLGSYSTIHLITLSLGQLDEYAQQMVGVFGSPTPSVAFYLWLLLTGYLLYSGWSAGNRGVRSALMMMLLVLLVVPVALDVAEAPTTGYAAGQFGFYQSRYLMPYSLGLPLVATFGLVRAGWRAPSAGILVLAGIGQTATFVQALRRYTVGTHGSVLWFSGPWSPPYIGAIAPVIIFVLALAALLACTWLVHSRQGVDRYFAAPDAAMTQSGTA